MILVTDRSAPTDFVYKSEAGATYLLQQSPAKASSRSLRSFAAGVLARISSAVLCLGATYRARAARPVAGCSRAGV